MKKGVFLLCISVLFCCTYSCSESASGDASIEELQKEVANLKKQLEQNTKITKVAFEGDQMLLTFADGTTLKTATPQSVIPNIGDNGNWWVNGEDLGIKAKAQVPVIGSNGNWWCDGIDTGKPAQGDKGDKGDKGDMGTGISKVEYDEATGILKITLTDKTTYEFSLAIAEGGEGNVGGSKLEDTYGAYLLKNIYNGDFPFAEFTYDAGNKMTGATYYRNVLNTPQKYLEMVQAYNSDNKISSQKFTEYTFKNHLVAEHWRSFPEQESLNDYNQDSFQQITAEALYDLLFPDGLSGYNGTNPTKTDLLKKLLAGSREEFFDNTFVYSIKVENSNFSISKHIRRESNTVDSKYTFNLVKDGNQFYYYGPYYSDYSEYWGNVSSTGLNAKSAGSVSFNTYSDENDEYWDLSNASDQYCYYINYSYKYLAVKYSGNEDEKAGNVIKDYYTPESNLIHNMTGESGKFKMLKQTYRSYQAGEALNSMTFSYAYNGNNFDVDNSDGNICYIEMSGDKISKVMSYQDGAKKEFLKFNYNTDGKLATIDAPGENLTGIARFLYDAKNNPVEIQVNVDQLKGKGYDNELCYLGLAYRYTEHDAQLGQIVEKIKYASGNQPLLKINYNYGLKNFMNHTFTALNPILNTFNTNNAISELIWAGHGSCFMTEFSNYNEGGYPTRFKGVLQLSDQDVDEIADYPINGSVATLYKLEYQKKQ